MSFTKNTNDSNLSNDQDPLFELIESMSANEKRYFNVQVKHIRNNDGTIPDYFIFFQILNKMEVYDEDKAIKKLLKKLGKKGFSNFTVKKNELYDALMRHLKKYHFTRMKKSAAYIKILIQDANFLFKRGLFRQANRNLKDARKMAENCGDTLSLIEINRFEREYLRTNRVVKMEERIGALHNEEEQLLDDLKMEATLIRDYDLLISKRIQQSKLVDKKSIEDLKNQFGYLEDLKNKKDLSPLSERFLLNSLSDYYHLGGENQSLFETRNMLFDWWSRNDLWRKQLPHNYINSLSNLLGAYHRNKNYNEFPKILSQLEQLNTNNLHEESRRFHRLMTYRLIYYLNVGLLDEACNLSNPIKKGIKKYKLNEGVQIALIYNIAVANFLNDKYEVCIDLIEIFKPFQKIQRGKLLIQFSQLLKIIALYEMGDFEQFEKSFKSIYKYFNTYLQIADESFEIVILNFLKKIAEALPLEKKLIYKKIKEYVELIQSTPETYRQTGAEELMIWANSKLKGQQMKFLINAK